MDEASVARGTTSRASDIVEDAAVGSDSTSQIINTLMYQCEVKDCHFEHVQVGGTTVCMAPYISPDAAKIMAEIRRARQDYRLPPFKLPEKNSVFAGRDDELSQLATCFAQPDSDANTTEVVILGKGGAGKSQLAIAYARDSIGRIETSCTSTAEECAYNYVVYFYGSIERLSRDICVLAREIGFAFNERDVSAQVIARAVYRLLSHLPRVLFVVDGLDHWTEELKALLPPRDVASFYCLYTSREHSLWQTTLGISYHKVELKVFDEFGAREYFHKAANDRVKAEINSEEHWVALAGPKGQLGGLPLALSQAIAYLNEEQGGTQDYLKAFGECFAIFASHPPRDDYHYTVLTTWLITLPKLLALSPQAVEIFFSLAYLHGDEIPRGIIEGYCQSREGWSGLKRQPVSIKKQVRHLLNYSMINELDEEHVQMHQLLQQTIVWWLSERREEELDDAKSSSTPSRATEHQQQITLITQQITHAVKQGCQTEPYSLICTLGDGLSSYNETVVKKKGVGYAFYDNSLLGQAARLMDRLLSHKNFVDKAQRVAREGFSETLGKDDKLVALFLKLWIIASSFSKLNSFTLYSNTINKLIEFNIRGFEFFLPLSIEGYLTRISPENPPSRTQLEIMTDWIQRILSKRLINSDAIPLWNSLLACFRESLAEPAQQRRAIEKIVGIVADNLRNLGNPCLKDALEHSPFVNYAFSLLRKAQNRLSDLHADGADFSFLAQHLAEKYELPKAIQSRPYLALHQYMDKEMAPHCSESGFKAITMQLYLSLLISENKNFFEAHEELTLGMAKMSEISEDQNPSDSVLGQMAGPYPLSLVEAFGDNYDIYKQAEEASDDIARLTRAADLSFSMGFYKVSGHYLELKHARQKNTETASVTTGNFDVRSHLAFLYLVIGKIDEADSLFEVLLSSPAGDKACPTIYYAHYFISQKACYQLLYKGNNSAPLSRVSNKLLYEDNSSKASLSLEKVLSEADFPITFNCWCQPRILPHTALSYLEQANKELLNACKTRHKAGFKSGYVSISNNTHFPVLVLSSHQLALLWMLEFACEQSEPQNETNRKQRCYELMQRLSKLPLATFVKERLDFFYDYKSQLLLRQHLWQKIVLPMTGFLPPEIVSQNRPSATVTGKEDLQLNRLLSTYKLSDTSSNTLEKGLRNAAVNNRVADVKAFLSLGVTVNAQDTRRQRTALHWAVLRGHAAVVETLLAAGGRYDIPDSEGETARMMARREGNESIIAQLEADEMLEQGLALLEENIAQNYSAVEETEVIRPVPAPVNPGVYTSSPASLNTSNPTTDAVLSSAFRNPSRLT